jgi:hypothetical protein
MHRNTYKYRKEVDFSKFTYKELQALNKKLTKYISEFKKEYVIPLSLFKTNLAPLETLTKFLIENNNLTIKDISVLLNRSPKTIWQAYKSSKSKHKLKFTIKQEQFLISVSIFSNRNLSVLESLVSYLKETQNLKFSQIASLLDRDQRTIWTLYSRARKKNA